MTPPADLGALQAAGSMPLAAPRPEPVPARDYAWCGATRINVPQLLGGAEVDVTLQVRTRVSASAEPAETDSQPFYPDCCCGAGCLRMGVMHSPGLCDAWS